MRALLFIIDLNDTTFALNKCEIVLYVDDKHIFTQGESDYECYNDIYLFINYNIITNYIIIIYKLSNFDHVLGVVSQTRVYGGNRTHDPHANSLSHHPLDYESTQLQRYYARYQNC